MVCFLVVIHESVPTSSLFVCHVGNKEVVAELLLAFFDYWAWRHDYNGMVVSVRTGGLITKAAKNW